MIFYIKYGIIIIEIKKGVLLVTDSARKIKDKLNVIHIDRDELNKLIDERNDWRYDALYMHFEQIVNELESKQSRGKTERSLWRYSLL